jgi:hypothetical protein
MSYTWEYLQDNLKETQRLIGISFEQLIQLIEQGRIAHEQKQAELESQKVRLIRRGGGAPSKLSVEDQILLTLVYLRQGVTFQLLGLLFQVSESTANNLFHYWQTLFQDNLPPTLLEQVKKLQEDEEKLQEILQEYELIVDSAEQARDRPEDYQERKKYYSGKKGFHTMKNQFIVLPNGSEIVDVVAGQRGPCSDINLWRSRQNQFHPSQQFAGDKAYVGEPQIRTPHKKPKKRELTEEQKQENRQFASERIYVEHLIRVVKVFKVAQEKFRLSVRKYESVMLTLCGLVRLRIGALVLQVEKSGGTGAETQILQRHCFSSLLSANGSNSDAVVNLV